MIELRVLDLGHIMGRQDLVEKTVMLGKTKGTRKTGIPNKIQMVLIEEATGLILQALSRDLYNRTLASLTWWLDKFCFPMGAATFLYCCFPNPWVKEEPCVLWAGNGCGGGSGRKIYANYLVTVCLKSWAENSSQMLLRVKFGTIPAQKAVCSQHLNSPDRLLLCIFQINL